VAGVNRTVGGHQRVRSETEDSVVEVGQPAPQFTLLGEGNKEVSLADFRGQNLVRL
jgi:peroxiredoxin